MATINSVIASDTIPGLMANFGGYVRGKSSMVLTVSATGTNLWYTIFVRMNGVQFYGANGDATKYPGGVFNVGGLPASGDGSWSVHVQDSLGGSVWEHGTFSVYEYVPPVINAFAVRRYEAYVDDQGTTQYRDSDIGDHVRVGIAANVASVNGKNAFSMAIKYNVAGSSAIFTAPVLSSADGQSIFFTMNRDFISSVIALGSDYEFQLVLTDWFHTVESFDSVSKAEAVMHVGPYGVAFGGFSTATPTAKKDEFAVPVYFSDKIYDGEDEIQDPGWTDLVFLNGENRTFPPDYHLQYKKIGKHVWIRGIITVSFTGTSKAICDLPFPSTGGKIIYAVGGGNNRVSLSIAYATQTLNISGVTSAAGASVTNFNSWVDCSIDYWTD